ncbi:MAG TPA: hypothetical protein VGX95_14660 [Xanthobacteraceae bacterium]|jgi:hypothetical protein|nr:hypothetical protein [Xanthobacteraceae bacterium]
MAKTAQVGYSKAEKAIELIVPKGTKHADLAKILSVVLVPGVIGKLPRPCNTCTSGDHWLIREELDAVINVNLDKVG